MNSTIELCKATTTEPQRCIADYCRDTRDALLATKSILTDIQATIVGGVPEVQQDDKTPGSMTENVRMNNEIATQITNMADTIRKELFGR